VFGNNSDKEWEKFGKKDPYYWVTTLGKYRDDQLTKERFTEFFSEGQSYTKKLFEIICQHIDPSFLPRRALDFGCGVGRIAIPLSEIAENVVGMDVSETMLAEARKNCREKGVSNLSFVKGDDRLNALTGTFNFIHSIYVFQHIPWVRGKIILLQMLKKLDENGVISLQLLISNTLSRRSRLTYWMQVNLPLVKNFQNLRRGKKWRAPMMQLNSYDLNRVIEILENGGCRQIYLRHTKEAYYKGVIIIAQKHTKEVPGFIDLGNIP
jgi:ubiquinone/menaquinone biosynthesis C-methylase UbiE